MRFRKQRIVQIIDHAEPALRAVKPNKPLNIALGIVVGLAIGVGLAFFIEYLDTSVKTIDDVERALQAPVLGVIPQNVGSLLEEGPDSPHAEAYRVLRTNILFSRKDDKLNTDRRRQRRRWRRQIDDRHSIWPPCSPKTASAC